MQVILDSSFARPSSAPIWAGKKGEFRDWTIVGYEVIITNSCYALVGYFLTSYPTRAHGIIVIYTKYFRFLLD